MKNIKKVSLLVLLGMLASCNNINSSSNSTKPSNNKTTTKVNGGKKTTTTRRIPTTGFTAPQKTTTTTAPEISSNNNIKNIKINGQDVRYKKDKTDYSVKLPYDMTEIAVTVELES